MNDHHPNQSRAQARDWDAGTYDRVSGPQVEWARKVLDRLPLEGDETVLDAGCGSGRVTALLLERLPRGHVIAVDAAPSMVEHAAAALGEGATVICSDLLDLELERPVDAAFSNAVFHWVPDHPLLFRRLHATLRPGAPLIAQYGGHGNVAGFLAIAGEVAEEGEYAQYLTGWEGPWNFTRPEAAKAWLEDAGFVDVETWLEPWPVRPSEPEPFIRTVCLGPHLKKLPEALRDPFVKAVAERIGNPFEIDYVRLNVNARRGG